MTEHAVIQDSSADNAALIVRTPHSQALSTAIRLKTVTIHDLSPSVGIISPKTCRL